MLGITWFFDFPLSTVCQACPWHRAKATGNTFSIWPPCFPPFSYIALNTSDFRWTTLLTDLHGNAFSKGLPWRISLCYIVNETDSFR